MVENGQKVGIPNTEVQLLLQQVKHGTGTSAVHMCLQLCRMLYRYIDTPYRMSTTRISIGLHSFYGPLGYITVLFFVYINILAFSDLAYAKVFQSEIHFISEDY